MADATHAAIMNSATVCRAFKRGGDGEGDGEVTGAQGSPLPLDD